MKNINTIKTIAVVSSLNIVFIDLLTLGAFLDKRLSFEDTNIVLWILFVYCTLTPLLMVVMAGLSRVINWYRFIHSPFVKDNDIAKFTLMYLCTAGAILAIKFTDRVDETVLIFLVPILFYYFILYMVYDCIAISVGTKK